MNKRCLNRNCSVKLVIAMWNKSYRPMYNQSFSSKELYACVMQAERRNSGLPKDDFIKAIDNDLGESLIDGTYQFEIKQSGQLFLNGRDKHGFGYLCQKLILRKIQKNIEKIYSVHQTDRNAIVKQMKILLSENVDMWVVRLDVRHFYKSINRETILNKLLEDSRLSNTTLGLLQELFKNSIVASSTGLPRGLGISAVLSELYMKYFDLSLRRVDGVYYYARFVDDIIVFCSSQNSADLVMETAKTELSKLGLTLNKEKSYIWKSTMSDNLVYLGYAFKKEGKSLNVAIAEKKIKKIKTKLTKSFVRFAKDRNYNLLKLRIKILTGNFTIYRTDTLLPIKVGIYFNYRMATNIKSLDLLDKYYQRMLHCQRGRLGSRLNLTKVELSDLQKYSFRFGFEQHVSHYFTKEQMREITNCWL